MSVVHFYDLPQVVHLSTGMGASLMNFPASRSDIYFAKNVTNDIDFYVKDIDRKPVAGESDSLTLRVADRVTGKIVLTVSLNLIDAKKALYRASIPPAAIEDFALGFYAYSVARVEGGQERLLYADRDRTERAYVEVREGPIPAEAAPSTILSEDLLPLDAELYSSALLGSAALGSITGIMSVAVYGNHFTGTVLMQGSLEAEVPTDDAGWFNLSAASYQDLTGVSGFTVEANVLWVRFRITDATLPEGQGEDAGSTGAISCLSCTLDNEAGDNENAIEWPADTARGLVKIVYRA